MATLFTEKDCNPELLKNMEVALIGYGAQGHAHAQNLRDSGVSVRIGLREDSTTRAKAEADGFRVMTTPEAVAEADFVMVLAPDEAQGDIYDQEIKPYLKPGATLAFCHGFSVLNNLVPVDPDHNLVLIAPKGQGHMVRRTYLAGNGVPGLVGVEHDADGQALALALSYAHALGCARMGIYLTTFKEEAVCDLFGEQAVLCGGAMELMRAGFQTLVDAGYQPEIAYFECIHEMKLIADLVYENGFGDMFARISDTAEYGGYLTGKSIITEETRTAMKECLDNIEDGSFAKSWVDEYRAGKPNLLTMRKAHAQGLEESVGKEVRSLFTQTQGKVQ